MDYNPTMNIDRISEILTRRFPEYRQQIQTWGINAPFIRLKKSMFVYAIVFFKQRPKKNQTVIGINGNMAPLATFLFGFIFHYLMRGNFLDEVEIAIQNEI